MEEKELCGEIILSGRIRMKFIPTSKDIQAKDPIFNSTKEKDFIESKNNRLINPRYDLSLNEQKILLVLASKMNLNGNDFNEQSISVRELSNILKVSSQNLYRDIPKITKRLISETIELIEVSQIGEKRLVKYRFLNLAKYNKSTGVVTLKFNEELKPYLLELKKLFTSYRLENALSLSSKYSIRVYEKCKQNAFKGSFVWKIEEIKEELKLTQKAYEIYNNLKRKVLDISFVEVNNNTDLSISYTPIKEGRKVVAIDISIKERKLKCHTEDSVKIKELCDIYGEDIINQAIAYTNNKKGEVKHYWKYVEGVAKKLNKEIRTNNKYIGNNRNYDYDKLERALLGWDIEDREEADNNGIDYISSILKDTK